MTETLLSTSNVLLFGRVVADIQIVEPQKRVPTARDVRVLMAFRRIDVTETISSPDQGVLLADGSTVLVFDQDAPVENGLYKLRAVDAADDEEPVEYRLKRKAPPPDASNVYVRLGTYSGQIYTKNGNEYAIAKDRNHSPFAGDRPGVAGQLQKQLSEGSDPKFARVYAFAFEGTYYELPSPVLFLVHGNGTEASLPPLGRGDRNTARMPGTPSVTGIAAADYYIADDVRVWSYDKGDFTIRMDVETGMIEDILLGPFFGGDGGGGGGRLSGAKVSGAKVSGAKVSGAKVAGAKLSGRWDPSD